jgi:hypothetical protein
MFWSSASHSFEVRPIEIKYHTNVLITTLKKNLAAKQCTQNCIMNKKFTVSALW